MQLDVGMDVLPNGTHNIAKSTLQAPPAKEIAILMNMAGFLAGLEKFSVTVWGG